MICFADENFLNRSWRTLEHVGVLCARSELSQAPCLAHLLATAATAAMAVTAATAVTVGKVATAATAAVPVMEDSLGKRSKRLRIHFGTAMNHYGALKVWDSVRLRALVFRAQIFHTITTHRRDAMCLYRTFL